MDKTITNGACLPLGEETQALGSTGFHELRESILGLDESKTAYDTIGVDVPYTRCMFVAGLTKWAETVNKGLLDYLEKISKGECVKALNVNYARFSNKDYWLRGRMKSDMTTYSDIPLKLNTGQCEYASSLDLYKAYETIVCEMAANFKKVESTFNQPKLYEPLMQQMREQYADSLIDYEYAQMKERYIEPTLKDYKKMQVTACIELLKSGMLNNVLSISNEEIDKVDEEKLHKLLDPDFKTPDNLKKLWAKFKKFMELKEDVMLVPRRDLIRIQVLKHFDQLNENHFRALFKLDKLLMLMHEDMIKKNPELAKYLNGSQHEQAASVEHNPDEEMFHFVHPSLDDEEGWKIHKEVKRLVKRQSVQGICLYLNEMAKDKKILLPPMLSAAYTELVRMGMSDGEGYTLKTFMKYYRK